MTQILIVEDDPELRSAIARDLGALYDVTTARDGRDALVSIRAGHRFDVILSDVNTPHLDATQLYWQLVEIAPGQAGRVIFMSAGSYMLAAHHVLLGNTVENPTVVKPFESGRLH